VKPSFLVQRASLVASVRSQQSGHCRMGTLPEVLASERIGLGPAEEPNDEGAARSVVRQESGILRAYGVCATDEPVFDAHAEKHPAQQGQDHSQESTFSSAWWAQLTLPRHSLPRRYASCCSLRPLGDCRTLRRDCHGH